MLFLCSLGAVVSFLGFGVVRAGEGSGLEDLNPHYSDTLCTSCHIDEEDYELRSEDQVGFCNQCHGEGKHVGGHHPLRPVPEDIQPPPDWPTLENRLTCLTCHLPGHEEYRSIKWFLRDGPYENIAVFCERCHVPDFKKRRIPHAEANQGKGCGYCHDTEPEPGVDTLATVTFCANPVVLCLRCHETQAHPANHTHLGVVDEQTRKKFESRVKLYQGDTIICSTCHNPHVLESEDHKLRGVVAKVEACPGCHDK